MSFMSLYLSLFLIVASVRVLRKPFRIINSRGMTQTGRKARTKTEKDEFLLPFYILLVNMHVTEGYIQWRIWKKRVEYNENPNRLS